MNTSMEKNNTKPWYKKTWFIVVSVLFIFYIIGTVAEPPVSEQEETKTDDKIAVEKVEEPILKVTTQELVDAYEENGVSAAQKYEDNMVEITGNVDTIGKDIIETPYITLKVYDQYSFTQVQCMFKKVEEDKLAEVSKNQKVVLRGRVSGKLLNIIVKDCKVIE